MFLNSLKLNLSSSPIFAALSAIYFDFHLAFKDVTGVTISTIAADACFARIKDIVWIALSCLVVKNFVHSIMI